MLKGGVLLAAFGVRRPTRDIDFQATGVDADLAGIKKLVGGIANVALDDGVVFHTADMGAETIREENIYPGVRVNFTASLATARLHLHVDVNIGDPVKPPAEAVQLPRLLGGDLHLLGFPLAMVHAEKIILRSPVAQPTLDGETLPTSTSSASTTRSMV